MAGLNEADLEILKQYADDGNRELYWNYLAHRPGNDGYALLALGVVRDDNVPGQVANRYAADYARVQQSHHGSEFADRAHISEREWDAFGGDLIKEDLVRRQEQFNGGRPDLALNLPVRDVQRSHDVAFHDHRIDPNAWTPRILLEAARRQDGEAAAERIWGDMLNNDLKGLERAGDTTRHVARYLEGGQRVSYGAALGTAYLGTGPGTSNTDPDLIHRARGLWTERDARSGSWHDVVVGYRGMMSRMRVTDPDRLAELEDTRALRLEVQERRTRFHEDDPHREIAASPRVLADNGRGEAPAYLVAALAPEAVDDIRSTQHAGNTQYLQALQRVNLFESQSGIPGGAWSERLAASLAVVAQREGIDFNRAYLEGGPDGAMMLEERARYGMGADDGRRFFIDAGVLSGLPLERSSREWAMSRSPHYVSDASPAERTPAQAIALDRLSAADATMFERIRGGTPGHIDDDHVLQALVDARRRGLQYADQIRSVEMDGDLLKVSGEYYGSTAVDVSRAVQPGTQSVEVLAGLEHSRSEPVVHAQQAAQEQQGRSAPVMAM